MNQRSYQIPSSAISFTVSDNPIPKARARVVVQGNRTHAYTPRRTKHWEAQVKDAAQAAMAGRPPLQGLVAMELWIWRGDLRRADADNIEKGLSDACNEIVYLDDDQIVEMHRYKGLDRENPRAEVTVWELEGVEW